MTFEAAGLKWLHFRPDAVVIAFQTTTFLPLALHICQLSVCMTLMTTHTQME